MIASVFAKGKFSVVMTGFSKSYMVNFRDCPLTYFEGGLF